MYICIYTSSSYITIHKNITRGRKVRNENMCCQLSAPMSPTNTLDWRNLYIYVAVGDDSARGGQSDEGGGYMESPLGNRFFPATRNEDIRVYTQKKTTPNTIQALQGLPNVWSSYLGGLKSSMRICLYMDIYV